ncbi:integrase [Streptomyces mirabilis]
MQRLVELAQYTSAAFAQVCDLHGIRRSMGRVGSSYDCEDDQVPLRAVA